MSAIPSTPSPQTPKHTMEGVTLPSGWTLVEQIKSSSGASGGTFGVGYRATKGGETAFVKVIDFVEALGKPDPILELQNLIGNATFEKDVLAYCTERGMTRVMRFLGHEYFFTNGPTDLMGRVSCLIMEAGETDLRRLMHGNGPASCLRTLQVMDDVSLALAQLHRGGIAHQDIKPSNVISVAEKPLAADRTMKVADLGRVVRREQAGPFDKFAWPGDLRYSPPERWYGHVPTDWCDSRDASDAYMLGSLLLFLSTGIPLQALVGPLISNQYRPGVWGGSFDDDLLAVLVDAHARVLEDHLKPSLMPEVADGVMQIAKELTHPDPMRRGDGRARRQIGRPVGLDRIQQKIHALALRSAAIERGRLKA